jgi:hypothetical protein
MGTGIGNEIHRRIYFYFLWYWQRNPPADFLFLFEGGGGGGGLKTFELYDKDIKRLSKSRETVPLRLAITV